MLALGAVFFLHRGLTATLLDLGLFQPAHHLGLGRLHRLVHLGHLHEHSLQACQPLLELTDALGLIGNGQHLLVHCLNQLGNPRFLSAHLAVQPRDIGLAAGLRSHLTLHAFTPCAIRHCYPISMRLWFATYGLMMTTVPTSAQL